jgi:hypothetical protein
MYPLGKVIHYALKLMQVRNPQILMDSASRLFVSRKGPLSKWVKNQWGFFTFEFGVTEDQLSI